MNLDRYSLAGRTHLARQGKPGLCKGSGKQRVHLDDVPTVRFGEKVSDYLPRVRCPECNRRLIPRILVCCPGCECYQCCIPPHRPKQDFIKKKGPGRKQSRAVRVIRR